VNLFARVLLFLLVATSWVSVHAYADVAQGLSWLAKQQQITGGVVSESPLAHPFQSTVETILAFDIDNTGW